MRIVRRVGYGIAAALGVAVAVVGIGYATRQWTTLHSVSALPIAA